MFVVRYHKTNDRMNNRTYERDFKDAAPMCNWLHKRVLDHMIDYFEIKQESYIYGYQSHDVTDVYEPIIYSGLSALEIRSVENG